MAKSPQSNIVDVESSSAVEEYLEGIADFSAYIGSDRDLALFRRFDTLGARNLTYYQLELLALEEQLREYDEEDKQFVKKNSTLNADGKLQPNGAAKEVLLPAKDWKSFVRRAPTKRNRHWSEDAQGESPTGQNMKMKDSRQYRKMMTILRIREVLKEYQEALILHSQVLQLESPGSRPLQVFQEWFRTKRPFMHSANDLYSHDDVVALRPSLDQDRLSKILQKRFGWAFKVKRQIPKSWGNMVFYSEKNVRRTVQFLSVLFAAFALTAAIICLSLTNTKAERFGAFAGFLFAFVLVIGTMTTAKTSEMLAATAAYGAVLVVFIGTGLKDEKG